MKKSYRLKLTDFELRVMVRVLNDRRLKNERQRRGSHRRI